MKGGLERQQHMLIKLNKPRRNASLKQKREEKEKLKDKFEKK